MLSHSMCGEGYAFILIFPYFVRFMRIGFLFFDEVCTIEYTFFFRSVLPRS